MALPTCAAHSLHYLEKYKIMVMKCPSKFELRRICRTTGANTLVRLEPPTEADLDAELLDFEADGDDGAYTDADLVDVDKELLDMEAMMATES